MNPEEWRRVGGFPDYEVSSLGRVRSFKSGDALLMRTPISPSVGYRQLSTRRPGFRKQWMLHQLVALTFLGPPPTPRHEVAHADGDRANSALSNLRWATRKENHADKRLHGTLQFGERHHQAKFTDEQVRSLRAEYAAGAFSSPGSRMIRARALGVSWHTFNNILKNKTWKDI
jgi:hypothetical protein